jgi:hypothetical protein
METETSSAEKIFGDHALQLCRYGLAVVPLARDRRPFVSGFNRWSRPPAERTVARWCEQYPDANIGLLPGLSGVMVVDSDDATQDEQIGELFGPTPLRILTSRGRHRYYRRVSERLPGDLRKFGFACDLKTGNSIVIVPPSLHESGKRYRFDDCDWTALPDVPLPQMEGLRALAETHTSEGANPAQRQMRDGSRKQWLNDLLCRHAMSCDTLDELLDVAMSANQSLADSGLEPLDDATVLKRTQVVWEDAQAGKLEQWVGREGRATLLGSELDRLCRLNPRIGPDAFALLAWLRIQHSARSSRGETFNITPKAMARDQVIYGWERRRYMRARDLLLLAGFIEKVAKFRNTRFGPVGSQYRLTMG